MQRLSLSVHAISWWRVLVKIRVDIVVKITIYASRIVAKGGEMKKEVMVAKITLRIRGRRSQTRLDLRLIKADESLEL